MKPIPSLLRVLGLAFAALSMLTGCASTDEDTQVSGSMYYGAAFYDPWHYGGYYDDVDIIVTPPPKPDAPPHPSHPIATPPPGPRPTPMPSIPSVPRSSFRR